MAPLVSWRCLFSNPFLRAESFREGADTTLLFPVFWEVVSASAPLVSWRCLFSDPFIPVESSRDGADTTPIISSGSAKLCRHRHCRRTEVLCPPFHSLDLC